MTTQGNIQIKPKYSIKVIQVDNKFFHNIHIFICFYIKTKFPLKYENSSHRFKQKKTPVYQVSLKAILYLHIIIYLDKTIPHLHF